MATGFEVSLSLCRASVFVLGLFATACTCKTDVPRPVVAPLTAPQVTLTERLRLEATHRPDASPTVETVVAAFADGGAPVSELKQFLGSTVGASYCAGGATANGVAIAVCEYPSAAAAEEGRAGVIARFPAVTGRRSIINRSTMLTLTSSDELATAQTRDLLERTFTTLP